MASVLNHLPCERNASLMDNSTDSHIPEKVSNVLCLRFTFSSYRQKIPIGTDSDAFVSPPHDTAIVETTLEAAKAQSRTSLSSASSKSSDYRDICRICHCEGTTDEVLISPCYCLGTMQYLHQSCLQRWIKSAGVKSCELCKFEFIMHSEIKPFKQVTGTSLSRVLRRRASISFVVAEIRHECGREKKSDVLSGIQFDCRDVCTLVIVSTDRTDPRRTGTWKSP